MRDTCDPYLTSANGKPRWAIGYRGDDGKRHRKYFETEEAAKKWADEDRDQRNALNRAWNNLDAKERADLMSAYEDAAEMGETFRSLVEERKRRGAAVKPIALGKAVEECIKRKEDAGRSGRYTETMSDVLGRFAKGREERPVSSITPAECDEWLGKRAKGKRANGDGPLSSWTRAGRQSVLSTLFKWCIQQGFATDNPIKKLEKITLKQRSPLILTPGQVDAALEWLKLKPEWKPKEGTNRKGKEPPSNEDFRGYLVLGLFCGVRPEELEKLTWDSVHVDRALVEISAEISKVGRRRPVPIAPRAVTLLADCPKKGPVFDGSVSTLRRRRRSLGNHIGLAKWDPDIIRHTAASYMLTRDMDPGKVAYWLGNSVKVLLTRYNGLASPEDAAKFWGASVTG